MCGYNSKTKAQRRYLIRMAIAMGTYIALLVSTIDILRFHHPARTLTILLSILPSLPIIAVIAIVGLYLKEETDEFQRALTQQSLLWGIGITLAVTSVWGFLEMFSHVRHLPPIYVFTIFGLAVAICSIVQRRQYRSVDE
jgi:uncharacterized membrane protein